MNCVVTNWRSNTEIEEERARKEAEERKRIEEIETSTDPSMDEMGIATIRIPAGPEYRCVEGTIGVTRREMELIKLGQLDGYEIYRKQREEMKKEKIQKIEGCLTDEELKEFLGYLYHPDALEQNIKSSDGKIIRARLTQKELALYHLGALSQEKIDELCYEQAPISLWKIKNAILRVRQKNGKTER